MAGIKDKCFRGNGLPVHAILFQIIFYHITSSIQVDPTDLTTLFTMAIIQLAIQ